MEGRVHVEQEALESLKNCLATAGEQYKANLAKLTSLIEEITKGDIQGDPANDLLNKFNSKQSDFNSVAEEIDKAEEYSGVKGRDFATMISDLKNNFR